MEDEIEVTVTGFVRDEGSIVLLSGETDDGPVTFACEKRYAADILQAWHAGEEPVALVPDYMIVGG